MKPHILVMPFLRLDGLNYSGRLACHEQKLGAETWKVPSLVFFFFALIVVSSVGLRVMNGESSEAPYLFSSIMISECFLFSDNSCEGLTHAASISQSLHPC